MLKTTIDNEPLEGELLDEQFEQIVKPKSSGWKTALKLTALLFLGATVAQSVQWIWDSYQNQQMDLPCFCISEFYRCVVLVYLKSSQNGDVW